MARPVQQVKFRLNRTVSDWATSTEMVRQASASPDYVGPSVEEMERIGRDIAEVREQLRYWIWKVAAKEARGSSRRDRAGLRRILDATTQST